MRELFAFELTRVAGGGHSPSAPSDPCQCECPTKDKKNKNRQKGNNGFGNGGGDGVPGRSGFTDTDR